MRQKLTELARKRGFPYVNGCPKNHKSTAAEPLGRAEAHKTAHTILDTAPA